MTATAMLSRDDDEEELVEVDDNNKTVPALGGGGRRKGGFEESLRRTARPTALTGRMGAVTAKSTKTRGHNDDGGGNVVSRKQAVGLSRRR
jgi:hypothetical protein